MADENSVEPAALLELARSAAEAAGRLLAEGAGGAVGVWSKSTPTDPVSEVDRASEELIVGMLRRARPDDAVLGEEGGTAEGTSPVRWIVDPIDGTVNFLYGFPVFCVSVAAEVAGTVVAGVVHDPVRGETFSARRGAGAFVSSAAGQRRLRVSDPAGLELSLVGTGFAYDASTRRRQGQIVAGLLPRVRDIRRAGSAALDLCWVAAGRLDGYYETGTHAWDRAAGGLIAAEAGAWIGDLDGGPPSDEMTVAAAPPIAPELVGLLVRLSRRTPRPRRGTGSGPPS